jgi:hypothetical protein
MNNCRSFSRISHLRRAWICRIIFMVLALFLSGEPGHAELTGGISSQMIAFKNGKPFLTKDATATIKNEKNEVVAMGNLVIIGETLEVQGKQGASFAYSPSPEATIGTNWPTEVSTNASLVVFDGKNGWMLKDDHFFFMLECGFNFSANILIGNSLLLSSRISFPEGTYSLWGYSITVGTGGGAAVFKKGLPVDGENISVVAPDKKTFDFSTKKK